ncbi:vWA-MoxR associated conflict system protein [Streptomyces sp. NPDC055089]
MSASRPTATLRHALVIATQCPAANQTLSSLVARAEELHGLLTNPEVGGCLPSDPAGGLALRSGRVSARQIGEGVESAALRADEAGAELVLAFLGHGQTPMGNSTLYYMAYDSEAGVAARSVDVGRLVAEAGDRLGVKGVITLIDTCHAGAGAPDAKMLAGGFSLGNNRHSLLMAASAHQSAFDLDFSREISSILRTGIPGAGELLRAADLKFALTEQILRQNCETSGRDGDPDAVEELWVAVNAQRPAWTPGRQVGPIGGEDLDGALAGWHGHPFADGAWTRAALRDLHEQAGASASPGALRVMQVADGLIHAGVTGDMICGWAGRALTTPALRSVAADLNSVYEAADPPLDPLRPPKGVRSAALLQYVLEHASLRTSVTGDPVDHLAQVVAAVADRCGLKTDDEQVLAWARHVDGVIALNDAVAQQTAIRQNRAWRLVISLHAAQVDWPESLSVWLRDGPSGRHHEEFACEPNRAGVEQRIPEILSWARRTVPGGARIRSIDIVAPAPLLLTWEPENASAGRFRLGKGHTVVLRWAGRLAVPGYLAGMNEEDRPGLEQLEEWRRGGDGCAPVDWLADQDTRDTGVLAERLSLGLYNRAIGLDHRPQHGADVVERLLAHTPILLWPRSDSDSGGRGRGCLDEYWDQLPARFIEAYRHRWRAEAGGPVRPPRPDDERLSDLAGIRAAWHDLEWLDFCQWFEQHHPTSQWSA